MIEFIYKSPSQGHTEYKLQAKEYKKKITRYTNNDITIRKKTASSKLVGVKWCDIHKEWYIRA